jgi:hypothetical protein
MKLLAAVAMMLNFGVAGIYTEPIKLKEEVSL